MAMIEQTSFGTGYKLKECIDRKREILKLKNLWWCPDVESDGNYMVYGEPTCGRAFLAFHRLCHCKTYFNKNTKWKQWGHYLTKHLFLTYEARFWNTSNILIIFLKKLGIHRKEHNGKHIFHGNIFKNKF